jgi:tetratricopeptide (TPR) repeat protein
MIASSRADSLRLKDGTQLEGKLTKSPQGYRIRLPDGTDKQFTNDQIAAVQIIGEPTAAPASPALSNGSRGPTLTDLASLRRAVQNVSSVDQIIERYEKFITRAVDPQVHADATRDLEIWKQRKAEGLLPVAGEWITPQRRDEMRSESQKLIEQAVDLHLQGNKPDARSLVEHVLAVDPENAAALYLRGLALLEDGQLPGAREVFEKSNSVAPNNIATLNNLAVISWRQRHPMGALNYYDQAMSASYPRQRIVDNIAEALYALPREHRDNALTQKVVKNFNEQETALIIELEKEGLYRWGATWVDAARREELKAAEAKIQEAIDALSKRYDDLEIEVREIDRDIEDNERAMRQMESTRFLRDVDGRMIQLGLPSSYYTLSEDNERLSARRVTLQRDMQDLRRQATQVQRQLPVPKYTGEQQPIGPGGAPGFVGRTPPPPPPASMPAAPRS